MSASNAKVPTMTDLSYLHNGRQQFLRIVSYIKREANNISSAAPTTTILYTLKTFKKINKPIQKQNKHQS